jgi:hypothetical protein
MEVVQNIPFKDPFPILSIRKPKKIIKEKLVMVS